MGSGNVLSITAVTFLACLTVCVGVWFFYSPGKPLSLHDEYGNLRSAGISEKIFITIGGVKQGMFIRVSNNTNPVHFMRIMSEDVLQGRVLLSDR